MTGKDAMGLYLRWMNGWIYSAILSIPSHSILLPVIDVLCAVFSYPYLLTFEGSLSSKP